MKLLKILPLVVVVLVGTSFWGCGGSQSGSGTGTFSVESAYIQESGEHLAINAEYPVLKGFPGAESLNSEIAGKAETSAEEVRNAARDLQGRQGFSASLNSNYQYFHNKDLASIWISWDNYTGGAHGNYWIDSYTLNTDTGKIYTFPELFQEGSGGLEYVTNRIMEDLSDPEKGYFDTAAETVTGYEGKYPFLINGDNVVVYFQLYEIMPYVAGMPSFSFTSDELKTFLKPEIFDAIQGQESVPIRFLRIGE